MTVVLIIIAVALVVYGIMEVLRGNLLLGLLLVVLGLVIGPGGVSIFT
jgi:hypothetical protein